VYKLIVRTTNFQLADNHRGALDFETTTVLWSMSNLAWNGLQGDSKHMIVNAYKGYGTTARADRNVPVTGPAHWKPVTRDFPVSPTCPTMSRS
jgi:hypothetical protein